MDNICSEQKLSNQLLQHTYWESKGKVKGESNQKLYQDANHKVVDKVSIHQGFKIKFHLNPGFK